MTSKLVVVAQRSWRRLDGQNQLPNIVQDVKFAVVLEVILDRPLGPYHSRPPHQTVTKNSRRLRAMIPRHHALARSRAYLATHWAAVLAMAVAAHAVWMAVYYANQPLLETNAFRQTQTALTSYWMIEDGWQLDYQTPVAGYPWSIPFEFPIYQSCVALIAWLGHFALDPVGRLVSFSFLLACLWPAQQIARRCNFSQRSTWIFCALLWSSPYYLFWSRTFTIEIAAMFFTLAAIPYILDLRSYNPSVKSAILSSSFASLGMLQKITTTAPVIMVMMLVLSIAHLRRTNLKIPAVRETIFLVVAFLPPLVVGLAWVYYSDLIKEANAFGNALTSKNLMLWNFGTPGQRFDPAELKVILWDRIFSNNTFGLAGPLLVWIVLFAGARSARPFVFVCLMLFILPIFIFFNLHVNHEYYQASALVFLIGGVAVSVFAIPPRLRRYLRPLPVAAAFVFSNLWNFYNTYAPAMKAPASFFKENPGGDPSIYWRVADVIRRYTPTDSAIVIYGADWNGTIAYYSQRKSFTVPSWVTFYDAVWKDPALFIGGKELGALVFCQQGGELRLRNIMARPDIKEMPTLFAVDGCRIWFPHMAALKQAKHATCQGSIDVMRRGASVQFDNLLIEGRLVEPGEAGAKPDDVLVSMTRADGTVIYVSTHSVRRDDLKRVDNLRLVELGYEVRVNVIETRGEYVIGVARGREGELETCAEMNVRFVIE
jgi:hypothetical protein